MISWQRDTVFIGFGRSVQCEHCKNKIIELIEQQHTYTAGPLFWRNWYGDVFCICQICHYGFKLKRLETSVIASLLNAGKKSTKMWFDKLSERERKLHLRLLQKLKQNELILYLSGVQNEM